MLADAAVRCQHAARRVGAAGDEGCGLMKAGGGGGVKALPLDADAGAKKGQDIKLFDQRGGSGDRRFDLEHQPGAQAEGADTGDRCAGIGVFGMDRDEVGTGLGELVDLGHQHGVGGHQMDVEGDVGAFAQGGDEVGEEQQGGREGTVGDVDVVDVGVAADPAQVGIHGDEIGRPERELGKAAGLRQGIEPVSGRMGHRAGLSGNAGWRLGRPLYGRHGRGLWAAV